MKILKNINQNHEKNPKIENSFEGSVEHPMGWVRTKYELQQSPDGLSNPCCVKNPICFEKTLVLPDPCLGWTHLGSYFWESKGQESTAWISILRQPIANRFDASMGYYVKMIRADFYSRTTNTPVPNPGCAPLGGKLGKSSIYKGNQ